MKIILSHKIYFCFIFVLWKNLLKSLVVSLKLPGRLQPPLLKKLESRNVFLERLYTYLISLIILWNYVQYFLIPILRCISPRNFSISSTFQTYCHKTIQALLSPSLMFVWWINVSSSLFLTLFLSLAFISPAKDLLKLELFKEIISG